MQANRCKSHEIGLVQPSSVDRCSEKNGTFLEERTAKKTQSKAGKCEPRCKCIMVRKEQSEQEEVTKMEGACHMKMLERVK